VLNIHDRLKPEGTIVQFGGQTPLNLARGLHDAGVKIVGTSVESLEAANNRKLFNELVRRLDLLQPPGGAATSPTEAERIAARIGYPVLVRPSFVLGGRAMEICYDPAQFEGFVRAAFEASPDHPVLIDKFIEDAIEVDVDAVSDGREFLVAGILEHIEEAGTHSGDAAMALPPFSLSERQVTRLSGITERLARELQVCGLMNVQFAVKGPQCYILEVNPRASRTVPFVAKASGVPWAKIAAKCMVGVPLKEQGVTRSVTPEYTAVKEAVFPFNKLFGNDVILGPEMKSTGEVMGLDPDYGRAYAKAEMAAYQALPQSGRVFISVSDLDKRPAVMIAKRLVQLGFRLLATSGTHQILKRHGVPAERIGKIREGSPNMLELLQRGEISLVINTPTGRGHHTDEAKIRCAAVLRNVPLITTLAAAEAVVHGIESMREGYGVKALQDYYKELRS
jgi:carbamoyl-phosphate synthase large subunit